MALLTKCSLLLYEGREGVCHRCGRPLSGRQSKWCSHNCEDRYWEAHYWPLARKAALKRAGWKCERCGSREGLEVNHIEPLVGRGYNKSCYHHPSNLEVLCHLHHVEVTRQQRAARKDRRAASGD